MRIPFSQMRFASGAEHRSGASTSSRVISRRNEDDKLVVHAARTRAASSRASPTLVGLDGIRPVRNRSSCCPTRPPRAEHLVHEPSDPFHDGSDFTPTAGVDLRTSLGSNLTLNATVNPDFGQVEIDPAVVNLSDVESYFEEKRPFFTEGAVGTSAAATTARTTTGASTGRSRRSSTRAASAARRAAGCPTTAVRRRAGRDAHPRRGQGDRPAAPDHQLRHAARAHRTRDGATSSLDARRAATPRSSRSPTTGCCTRSRSSRTAPGARPHDHRGGARLRRHGGLGDDLNRSSL